MKIDDWLMGCTAVVVIAAIIAIGAIVVVNGTYTKPRCVIGAVAITNPNGQFIIIGDQELCFSDVEWGNVKGPSDKWEGWR